MKMLMSKLESCSCIHEMIIRRTKCVIKYTVLQWFSNYGTRAICGTDQKIVALCLYFYLTLLTQRCKGNGTQADKSQNHVRIIYEYIRVHSHITCTT